MRDIVIIASIASTLLAFVALGIAAWHHCRLEWHRQHDNPSSGGPG